MHLFPKSRIKPQKLEDFFPTLSLHFLILFIFTPFPNPAIKTESSMALQEILPLLYQQCVYNLFASNQGKSSTNLLLETFNLVFTKYKLEKHDTYLKKKNF